MAKIPIATAIIFSKRSDLRDAIRQAFKGQGLASGDIQNHTDLKQVLADLERKDYVFLVLDWDLGVDQLQKILEKNRSQHRLEAHPCFLLASKEDDHIIDFAREYHVSHTSVGEITNQKLAKHVKSLVEEYRQLSPIKQLLLNVDSARQKGEHQKAHQLLQTMYEKFTTNTRVALEYAESLIELGKWSEAQKVLVPLQGIEHDSARARHLYARCCLKLGQTEQAVQALQAAQEASPYNPSRLVELGDIFLDLDRVDEAMQSYAEVLGFAPQSQEAKLGKSRGMLLSGKLDEALHLLHQCANKRELSAVFNTAAIVAIRQGKFDQGLSLYGKAVQILKSESKLVARIIYNMGIGLVKSGEPAKAVNCFAKANELDQQFLDAGHNLRVLRQQLQKSGGKADGSLAAIDQSIRDTHDDFEEGLLDGLDESISASESMIPSGFGNDSEEDDFDLDQILSDVSQEAS